MLPLESSLLHSPRMHRNNNKSPQGFSTPRSSQDDDLPHKCSHAKNVQFGVAQAAEYDRDAPSAKFTPLPAAVAQQRFPLTSKKDETEGEEEEIAETKANSAALAEWDNDFDRIMDDDDDDDDAEETTRTSTSRQTRKLQSSKKDRSHKRQSNSNSKHSERRRSSAFGSPGKAKVLYDPTSDDADADVDTTTPDKLGDLDLADLTMDSPANIGLPAQPLSQESTEMSPVVARKLSSGPHNDIVPEETMVTTTVTEDVVNVAQHEEIKVKEAKKRKKLVSLVLVNNVWDAAFRDPSALELGEQLDPRTVFSNLVLTPSQLWHDLQQQHSTATTSTLETSATSWYKSVDEPFQTSLDVLSGRVKAPGASTDSTIPPVSPEQSEAVPLEDRREMERVAQYEWKKLELEFLQDLKKEINEVQIPLVAKTKLVDYLDVPSQASQEPTRKHSEEAERLVLDLTNAIAKEEKLKQAMEVRLSNANFQLSAISAPLAALSCHAVSHLIPFKLGMPSSQQGYQASFSHLLQGLETKIDLNGSMDATVYRNTELMTDDGQNDLQSKFYDSMLCSSSRRASGSELQGGFSELLLPLSDGSINEELLQMSVLMGRVDLAALDLQEIATLYKVSVAGIVEDEHPVVVVRIKLPLDTTVTVYYKRRDLRSVYWSAPSKVTVERNGQPATELHLPTHQRNQSGAAGIFGDICRTVQEGMPSTRT